MSSKEYSNDGRRTRWDAHRVARRRQIIESGLEILAEAGPDFGLDHVAERAGITKPVIYRHFSDRAHLVEAMGERATAILLDDWVLPVLEADTPPMERIHRSVEGFLGFLEAHPNIYWLYVLHAPAAGSDVAAVNKELIAHAIAAVLSDYLEPADLGDDLTQVWAHGLVGFVQNAAEWWLVRRTVDRDQLAVHLSRMIWAQFDGLARQHGLVLDPYQRVSVQDIATGIAAEARQSREP